MSKVIFVLTLTILCGGCYPSMPDQFAPVEQYAPLIYVQKDIVFDDSLSSVSFDGLMYAFKSYYARSTFSFRATLVKSNRLNVPEYFMQITIRTDPAERPLDNIAFMIVDGERFAVRLDPIAPELVQTSVRMESAGMDYNGHLTQQRIFSAEAVLEPGALGAMKPESEVRLIFHSGVFPVNYTWTESAKKLAIALYRS